MSKPLTREQLIKKGQNLRRFSAGYAALQKVFAKDKSAREERLVESSAGRVRTLWYGTELPANTPLYLDLHGGGFVLGSADMDHAMNLALQKQVGCKIVSVDYAKAPDHTYPAALEQLYALVQHLRENAAQYGIDPQRIAVGGHSAGGTLATALCMKAKQAGDFQFACQILDYPPTDLATDPYLKPQPKGAIPPDMALMFNACYVTPEQAKEPLASPIFATTEQLHGLPPALVILAGMDSLFNEGLRYHEMLSQAGVASECYPYPKALHGFTYKPSDDTYDAWNKMAAFLKKYLMDSIEN